MATYTVTSGKVIRLAANPLGSGGEGAVYDITGYPKVVAKIYHPNRINKALEAKIRAMISNPPADETRKAPLNHVSIAWPTDIVLKNGVFCGYIMPKLPKSDDLYALLHPKQREKNHPTLHHRHLYRTARNLAIAIDALHQKGYVIGDVNYKNALFNDRTLITIVDCDSMQVKDTHGIIHRCLVGVPEYTPPELQGQDFANVTRTPNHDAFGLAILIFQLLMQGFHPFSGTGTKSAPDIDLSHIYCISKRIFPYLNGQLFEPPKVSPDFRCIPGVLQQLFIRAFTQSQRPTPKEWELALELVETRLTRCTKNTSHVYPSDGACVICNIESKLRTNSTQTTGQQPLPTPPNTQALGTQQAKPQQQTQTQQQPQPQTSQATQFNFQWPLIIVVVLLLYFFMNYLQARTTVQSNADFTEQDPIEVSTSTPRAPRAASITALSPDFYPDLLIAPPSIDTENPACFHVEVEGDVVDENSWHLGDSTLDPNSANYVRYGTFVLLGDNSLVSLTCNINDFVRDDGVYQFDIIDNNYRAVARVVAPQSGISIRILLDPKTQTSTLSNQELTQTQVARQNARVNNNNQTSSTNTDTSSSTSAQQYLAIALDPGNGRDDANCISMNITGIDTLYWRLIIRGAPFDPAVFDASGNARLCNEWISQQSGFYVDIVNANFEPVPRGSAPAVGGDIFKSRWVTP